MKLHSIIRIHRVYDVIDHPNCILPRTMALQLILQRHFSCRNISRTQVLGECVRNASTTGVNGIPRYNILGNGRPLNSNIQNRVS